MQPTRQLRETLASLADREHCLFSVADLAAAVPDCRQLPLLLSRAVKTGILRRVCKGIYFYPIRDYACGKLLFHAAALLRAEEFNYISLETALSDAGLISQVPINWITLMSSGRSHIVNCGDFGTIEFIHTARQAGDLAGDLTYDPSCRLWRASDNLALRDMKATRRSLDLLEEGAAS
jgi:predicted transcriptional regulator of viral defense system